MAVDGAGGTRQKEETSLPGPSGLLFASAPLHLLPEMNAWAHPLLCPSYASRCGLTASGLAQCPLHYDPLHGLCKPQASRALLESRPPTPLGTSLPASAHRLPAGVFPGAIQTWAQAPQAFTTLPVSKVPDLDSPRALPASLCHQQPRGTFDADLETIGQALHIFQQGVNPSLKERALFPSVPSLDTLLP